MNVRGIDGIVHRLRYKYEKPTLDWRIEVKCSAQWVTSLGPAETVTCLECIASFVFDTCSNPRCDMGVLCGDGEFRCFTCRKVRYR